MPQNVNVRHKQLIKTEEQWSESGLALLPGELGYASDTRIIKVGTDGETTWDELPNLNGGFEYDAENNRLVLIQDVTDEENSGDVERSDIQEIQLDESVYDIRSKSTENQNQAEGAIVSKYDWVGTLEEYEEQRDNDEIPDDWVCFITDDISGGSGELDLRSYVRKATDETITGVKTFDTGTGNSLVTKSDCIDTTITPNDSQFSNFISNVDKNGTLITRIYTDKTSADGSNGIFLQAWNGNDNYIVGVRSNGKTYAPASDAANSIVTTIEKLKQANGFYKLGNGLIIQWGKTPAITTQSTEVMLPTAFTSANYSVVATMNSDSAVGEVSCYDLTTTSFKVRVSDDSGQIYNFIAIGV